MARTPAASQGRGHRLAFLCAVYASLYGTRDPSAVPTIVMTMNTLPDAVVTRLERVPSVEQFQQRSVYHAPWQYASSTQDHSMQLFVYQDMEHIKLWPFELVYGHLPGPGEIVLDTRNQLEGYQATLGDTIAVQAPNGQFVSLRVVGLSRTRGSAVGGLFANPIGYMSPAAFQLIDPSAANANTVNPVSAQVLAKTADAHALETYNTMKQILVSAHITLDAKSSSWNYAAGQATLQLRQLKTRINAILTRQGLNQSEVRTIQDLMQGTTDPLPTIYLLFFAVAMLVALVGLLSLSLTLASFPVFASRGARHRPCCICQ